MHYRGRMAEQDAPLPSLRASDADRERAADVLRKAGGAGRLTVEELDERLSAVYAARTQAELDKLLADVTPSREPSSGLAVRPGEGGARWIVSIMGGSDRKGRWRVSPRATVLDIMGGSNLDFNDAELAAEVVELRVFNLMGGSDIWVPEGLNVEVSEFAFMGGNDVHVGDSRPDPDGPLLRIRILSIMGGANVRRGRRRSRRRPHASLPR
jgi:hypothetical protein